MEDAIVRVKSFELKNLKNVNSGLVEVNPQNDNGVADIVGIYGQNGSGKTAVVDAFDILQQVLNGKPVPEYVAEFITKNERFMRLGFEFLIEVGDEVNYYAKYEFEIENNSQKLPAIKLEKLTYRRYGDSGHSNKSITVSLPDDDEGWIKPKTIYKKLGSRRLTDLIVAKKMSQKERRSLLFNQDVADCFHEGADEVKEILYALHNFSCDTLFVIGNECSNLMGLNILIPFFVKYETDENLCFGTIPMPLNEATQISKGHYDQLLPIMEMINPVLNEIVPGLAIGIECYGEQLNEKGEQVVKVELVSQKDGRKIPFRYESEGIKKIVSILVLLIAMYNDKSLCLVVDELDAGIFEFLLGELLSVLNSGGKGQLFFTSHNLRPLEVLGKNNIVFTTTNPQKRYVRFNNVKKTNNLRDLYIRALNLGGQREEIYKPTSLTKIGRAFRKAGKARDCK